MSSLAVPPFKAIFTDLDGTAVPSSLSGIPSQVVIDAVAKAQEKAYVSVATGRPFSLCKHIIDALQIKNLCIVEGGSQIINPVTEEIVWEQAMPDETVEKVKEVCAPYKFHERKPGEGIVGLNDQEIVFVGSNKLMFLFGCDIAEVERIYQRLMSIPEITVLKVHSLRKGTLDLHISHIGASKRHALEVLLAMLKLEPHEVVGIGDSQNDLPLFEAAGFKVAMGNAIPELKERADYIVKSVEEDGLAEAIEKFILTPPQPIEV